MLILTLSHSRDPSITITHMGEELVLHLHAVRSNGRVQLAFDAPLSFDIVRDTAKVKHPKGPNDR